VESGTENAGGGPDGRPGAGDLRSRGRRRPFGCPRPSPNIEHWAAGPQGGFRRRMRKTRNLTSEPNLAWRLSFSKEIIIVGFKSFRRSFRGLDKETKTRPFGTAGGRNAWPGCGRPSVVRSARSETCAEHWARPADGTGGPGAGDLRSCALRGRRPSPNIGRGRRTRREAWVWRPSVARTATTLRVPETRAEHWAANTNNAELNDRTQSCLTAVNFERDYHCWI
jgi:hypothetical protein